MVCISEQVRILVDDLPFFAKHKYISFVRKTVKSRQAYPKNGDSWLTTSDVKTSKTSSDKHY